MQKLCVLILTFFCFMGAALFTSDAVAAPLALQNSFFDAIRMKQLSTVQEKLLEAPELLRDVDKTGMTGLHHAAQLSAQAVADELILQGANIRALDRQGRTPLHYAALAFSAEVTKSLLIAGADINALDGQNKTPLDYAGSGEVRTLIKARGGVGGDAMLTTTDHLLKSILPASSHGIINYSILGFRLWRLLAALLVLVGGFIINLLIRSYIQFRAKEADKAGLVEADDENKQSFLSLLLGSLLLPARIMVWAVTIRLLGPILIPSYQGQVSWVTEVFFSIAITVFLYSFVAVLEYYLLQYVKRKEMKVNENLIPVLRKIVRTVVVILAGLHLYQVITNQPVTTILAGLGIGGLAFALAAQDTIKNLFGFVMIAIDRPFVVGDRIKFDGHDGPVESVGLRSTRVRTLDGHVVTIPNSRAADSVIHNMSKRPFIKRVMNITITYDTPVDKIEKALSIVRELLHNHEGMNPEFPPRVYFSEMKADSLNMLAIYWYFPPEYWPFMEHAEKVNLGLMRRFEAEGIDFAFPTQTIHIAGDSKRELVVKHLQAEVDET